MKRYADYKATGVEWMPEIPAGWKVRRLKSLVNYTVGGVWGDEPKEDANDIACLRVADFDMSILGVSTTKLTYRNIAPSQRNKRLFQQGDLMIEKSGGGENQTVGRCVRFNLNIEAVCSNFVAKINLRLEEADTDFIAYNLDALYKVGINTRSIKQTTGIQNLDLDSYLQENIALPPLPEQHAIARFLDDKTAQIDQLIIQKKQMLELLREERATLINHAVTKGLDAAAPLRDSGVEWLGEVPAHWEVKRLKHLLVKLEQGWSPSCESRPAEPEEWGVLKVGCVNGLDFDPTENKALPSELTPLPEYEINPGDFLISRANTKELVGSAVVVGEVRPKLLLCDKIFRLFFRENANKEYVLLIISSWYGRFQIQSESSGASSSMQNISQELLKNMLILLPSRHEQQTIVDHVAEQTSRILETTDTINQEIALLQEYRAALIAEAVIGQIDVREYAPVAAVLP